MKLKYLYFIAICSALLLNSSCLQNTNHTASESKAMKNNTMNLLKPCPNKPNCICSEFPNDKKHYIEPLALTTSVAQAISTMKETLESLGGSIKVLDEDYIHATFTSKMLRFVDDVEIRVDRITNKIHIRSASRVGYSDFGVNKKRIQTIKKHFISRH